MPIYNAKNCDLPMAEYFACEECGGMYDTYEDALHCEQWHWEMRRDAEEEAERVARSRAEFDAWMTDEEQL